MTAPDQHRPPTVDTWRKHRVLVAALVIESLHADPIDEDRSLGLAELLRDLLHLDR